MEKSSSRSIREVDRISWELFSKTGKIAYYGACASCKELLSLYERDGSRQFDRENEREKYM